MSGIVTITDATFEEEVLSAGMPVLVDFWAEWCGPCKMIAPVLEEIAADYEGRLKICKVNVDDNGASAEKFSVRSIPTLILFKDGHVESTKVGALSRSQLTAFLDSSL